MLFPNLLKGRLAESLLITLLERAGYRVSRIGVEELFNEVKALDGAAYAKLNLPLELRTIPDLVVAERDVSCAFLVEVKFRKRFDAEVARELCDTLKTQRNHWPQSYAVIMLGEPAVLGGRFHQDYIRVITPGTEDKLLTATTIWPDAADLDRSRWLWDGFPQMQTVFKRFHQSEDNLANGSANQQRADFITQTLADLAKL